MSRKVVESQEGVTIQAPEVDSGMKRPDRVYSYDAEILPDGGVHFLQVDPALNELLGYSVDDLQRDGWWNLILPEDERHMAAVVTAAENGEPWTGRFRISTRSGSLRIFAVHLEPEPIAGRPVVRAILRDITEEARSTVALQEREARLRLLSRNLSVVMWTTDASFNVIRWSGQRPVGERARPGTHHLTLAQFFSEDELWRHAMDASLRALKGETVTFEHTWAEDRFRFSIESVEDELGKTSGTIGVAVNLSGVDPSPRRPLDSALDDLQVGRAVEHRSAENETLVVGDLCIDPAGYSVRKRGKVIALTITEFKLLLEFAGNPGRVLSQQVLAERVWGYDFLSSQSNIPTAIKRLRDKIEDDPQDPTIIETVRGVGYKLVPPGT